MATRRRDPLPGKEKAASSPKTATSKLKETLEKFTRTNVSTAPKKQTRPTLKTTVTNVSKQQGRKPASTPTANKPSQPKTKPLLNNNVASPKPVRKAPVTSVAAAAPRLSSLTGKILASPKPVPRKSLKPMTKDEGKRRVSPSVSNVRRSSIGLKKETATKEQQQITSFTVDKAEDLSIYCVPEPEIQLKDIEDSYLAEVEAEEKLAQRLSNIGSFDVLETEIDQKPLCFAKVGDEIDPTVVIAEETPLDIKMLEIESKCNLEEELEQQTKNTTSSNEVEINSHEEAGEQEVKEVKEVKVAAEQEAAAVVSKAVDETKEIEKPAVEKKETSLPPKQQERMHGKFDSPVSNNVIEETATKLLEQRRNRVRALAGAFETVISLQEK